MATLLASTDDGGGGAAAIILLVLFAFFVLVIAGMWKLFVKAGEEGWKSIIPFYNLYVVLKIVGRPWWWLILMVIPFVGFVVWIIVANDLSKSFGQGVGFTVGLVILSGVFILILGFGGARYVGPGGRPATASYGTPPPPPPPPGPGTSPPPPPS